MVINALTIYDGELNDLGTGIYLRFVPNDVDLKQIKSSVNFYTSLISTCNLQNYDGKMTKVTFKEQFDAN